MMDLPQPRVLLVGAYLCVLCASACDNATTSPGGANPGGALGGTAGTGITGGVGGVMAGDAAVIAGGTTGGDAAVGSVGGTSGGVADASIDAGNAFDAGIAPGSGDAAVEASSGTSWDGCDEFAMPPDCTIPDGAVLPGELRCTGLYANWQERKLRCGVKPYVPAHELWADGAGKKRYVWLPPGQKIDVSNPDEFDYPVGTRFWKEFHVGPEGNQTLGETRYLVKVPAGWLYTAYVWSRDGSNAIQQNDGVDDLFGTKHSVPSREQCKSCHIGRQNFILGWDFIMLGTGATGVTAGMLAQEGRLNGPALLDLKIPGDAVEQAALAYLHANCGVSCHNTALDSAANPSGLNLRLDVSALASPLMTGAAKGINRRPAPNAELVGLPARMYYNIRPGDPERSLILVRMDFRSSESETAMPPIGTHVIHRQGVDAVRAWIASMTEARGYPAPAP
jgi:hypothetical protein